MSNTNVPAYYRCVEVARGVSRNWYIYLADSDVLDYDRVIKPEDLGDWISGVKGGHDIKIMTWDSFIAWSKELWPR
jgi:hypothetical protein